MKIRESGEFWNGPAQPHADTGHAVSGSGHSPAAGLPGLQPAFGADGQLVRMCLKPLRMKPANKGTASQKIRKRIDELFGPTESVSEEIQLDVFTENVLRELEPRFSHRKCRIHRHIAPTPPVFIPKDVLYKIIEGLLRNAIENTRTPE